MGGDADPEAVLRLVAQARRRMRLAAAAEAIAGPAAGVLLVAAAILAVARATGRTDLPAGLLATVAAAAAVLAALRLRTLLPGTVDAALHLDRSLGAGERFVTVLETAGREPGLAAWAARGAMARAPGDALGRALAIRPPGALLPLLLAGTLVAGLALLPSSAPDGATEGKASVPSGPASAAGSTGPARPVDAREALAALEARAGKDGSGEASTALEAARDALARGDDAAARVAMAEAARLLGLAPAGAPVAPVPGVTPGGAAAEGDPPAGEPAFRPMPVPLRAREAVERYLGSGK